MFTTYLCTNSYLSGIEVGGKLLYYQLTNLEENGTEVLHQRGSNVRNYKTFLAHQIHIRVCVLDICLNFRLKLQYLPSKQPEICHKLICLQIYANLVILATPVRIISYQVVSLGHLGGFVAF